MTALTFEALVDHYRELIDTAKVTAAMAAETEETARKILAAKGRYQEIEAATAVPWYFVGIIHQMEAGGSWKCHLHNGDTLAERTTHVPKNRPSKGKGPFTWEESAIDAIEMKNLGGITWTLERALYEIERYNGQGYLQYHPETPSPYLWSGTTAYSKGKYVEDGKWSATAVSKQVGAYPLLVFLSHADESAVLAREDVPAVEATTAESFRKAVPEEAVKQEEKKPLIASKTAWVSGGSSTTSGWVTAGMTKKAFIASKAAGSFDFGTFLMNTLFDFDVWMPSFFGTVCAGMVIYWRWKKGDIDGLIKSATPKDADA